jgi:AcrR family transcriptional regulator
MGVHERKEREKVQRRKQILDAGEKLFLKKGLQNTTMDEIANLCELSKGTLYLYYKSKEDLFLALLLKSQTVFIEMLKNAVGKKLPIREKLRELGTTYLTFYKKHPNYFKLLNHFEDLEPKQLENIQKSNYWKSFNEIAAKTQEIWEIVVQVIEEGKNTGYFKKNINSLEIGVLLWASSNGLIQMIDHFKNSCKNIKEEHLNLDKDRFKISYQFFKIDYEKLVYKAWEMLISAILEKKTNRKK